MLLIQMRASKKLNINRLNDIISPYKWLIPSAVLFAIFLLYPIIFSFVISFFKWSGYTPSSFENFVGLKNYIHLFTDMFVWKSFRNTIFLVISVVVFQNIIALFLALVIFFGKFKFDNLIRAIFFFPVIMSAVVVGLVFCKFFQIDGAVNQFLEVIGLSKLTQAWLVNPNLNIWIISFVGVWSWTGFNLVIFYAGLQSIDKNLLEAAFIDGATLTRSITAVVIPLLKPIIFLCALLNFIGGFKVFDLVWVMTNGGPAHSSDVLTTYMYYQSFQTLGPNNMGYGATIAMLMVVVVLIFSVIRWKFTVKQ
ncbi:MAG: sugar ABC transporter permease [Actinobacteria bacterium]|nr:sugar ABC transporter permease [Actinomycetota bacterium]